MKWTTTALGQESGPWVIRAQDNLWTIYRKGFNDHLGSAPVGHYATEATAKQAVEDLA